MFSGMLLDEQTNLWLSAHEGVNREGILASFALCKDAHRGVAGVVYTLSRLARFGYRDTRGADAVRRAVPWLIEESEEPQHALPGLHFGNAGIIVACAEAFAAGVLDDTTMLKGLLDRVDKAPIDWLDVTHGAAGQGLAGFYYDDAVDSSLIDLTHRCADWLVTHQEKDGSWITPAGVDGISGEKLTGFAHGVAGIVYFLAEYAARQHSERARRACEAGARWLIRESQPCENGEGLEWSYSDVRRERWKYWCHGGPGIALAFLKLFELCGEPEYAQVARGALCAHPKGKRHSNLSVCHGMSGLGEIYLEAWRVLGEDRWRELADDIGEAIMERREFGADDAVTWIVEEPYARVADLMVGCGGVMHFLLRLSSDGGDIGFPLLQHGVKGQTARQAKGESNLSHNGSL
jgi:lantibiotic modifying enzyme